MLLVSLISTVLPWHSMFYNLKSISGVCVAPVSNLYLYVQHRRDEIDWSFNQDKVPGTGGYNGKTLSLNS